MTDVGWEAKTFMSSNNILLILPVERRALEYVGINRQADGDSSRPAKQERGMKEKQRKPILVPYIHQPHSLFIKMIGQIRITRHWVKTNSIKEKNQVNQKNDWKQR